MDSAIVFVLRHRSGWRIVIGEQRIGAYGTAEAACWAAMSLAMHLREEGARVELRLHDDGGVRKLWPPEFASEIVSKSVVPRRMKSSATTVRHISEQRTAISSAY